jgi:tRNA-dihydrouridine synthase 1
VHGRTKEQNKQTVGQADWGIIKIIKSELKIPVFANGGIATMDDVEQCLKETVSLSLFKSLYIKSLKVEIKWN